MTDEPMSNNPMPQMLPQQILRANNYKESYCSTVRFKLSPNDCTMIFGTQPDMGGAPIPVIQDEVAITMTLSFFKALSINFNKTVAALEKEMGPIKILERTLATDDGIDQMMRIIREHPLIVP